MLSLKLADDNDIELVLAWRNNPLVWKGCFTQCKPIDWETHIKWWRSRPSSWREFIIWTDHRIGVVTIGQMEHWSPEIGYLIGETTAWGKGLGTQAVRLALDYLKEQGKEYCHTTVKKDNERSLKLLKGLGFEIMGDARPGEVWLTKTL